jgi:hypothetical protein
VVSDDPVLGLAEWRAIESVLTHPRCLNCHTMTDYPRQGDERSPHSLDVKRGEDGHGDALKCEACHTAANQAEAGIPGAPDWHLAPLDFAWESEPGQPAGGAAICATLKRSGEEGAEPNYERLIEYAQFASFAQWAWDPGKRPDGSERTTPPLSQQAFVTSLKRWISAGAPCPPAAAPTQVANPTGINPAP